MQFETWLSPPAAAVRDPSPPAVAVVIDVLRATTVAVTALAAGARQVTTCREVDQAMAMKAAAGESTPLLCGERYCRPIIGFDLGNSPSEYAPATVAGRDLIMTTTNGTRAIEAAANCETILLAGFVNLSAVVDYLTDPAISSSGMIRLVCAGTDGAVTLEDVLLAGAILSASHRRLSDASCFHDGPVKLGDDASAIALAMWQHAVGQENVRDSESLADRLARTAGGQNLVTAGYAADLADCAALDIFTELPMRIGIGGTTFKDR